MTKENLGGLREQLPILDIKDAVFSKPREVWKAVLTSQIADQELGIHYLLAIQACYLLPFLTVGNQETVPMPCSDFRLRQGIQIDQPKRYYAVQEVFSEHPIG